MRGRAAWQALRRSRRAIREAIEAARHASNESPAVAPTNVVRAVNVGRPGTTAVSSHQTVVHTSRRTSHDSNGG